MKIYDYAKAAAASMLVLMALSGSAARAQQSTDVGKQGAARPPQVLQRFAKQGVVIEALGDRGGLSGWLLRKDADVQTVYVTPDGGHFIVGLLYDGVGNLVTAEQLQGKGIASAALPAGPAISKAVSQPGPPHEVQQDRSVGHVQAVKPDFDKAWAEIEQNTVWFDIGRPDAPLLVFGLEPNCPYCRKAWPDLWTLVQDGKLRLRIVLTAFLKDVEDAKDKATAVLLAEDRGAMLNRIERGETFSPAQRDPDRLKKAGEAILINNTFLMEAGIGATPFFFWRGKDGAVRFALADSSKALAELEIKR